MSLTLFINLIGIVFIAFIVWWFWLYKPGNPKAPVQSVVTVKVKDGAYQPAYILAKVKQPITLRFIREDASACAQTVVFNGLDISQNLPLNTPADVVLTIDNPGDYEFTCQMGMYRGKIIATV